MMSLRATVAALDCLLLDFLREKYKVKHVILSLFFFFLYFFCFCFCFFNLRDRVSLC